MKKEVQTESKDRPRKGHTGGFKRQTFSYLQEKDGSKEEELKTGEDRRRNTDQREEEGRTEKRQADSRGREPLWRWRPRDSGTPPDQEEDDPTIWWTPPTGAVATAVARTWSSHSLGWVSIIHGPQPMRGKGREGDTSMWLQIGGLGKHWVKPKHCWFFVCELFGQLLYFRISFSLEERKA